MRNPTPAPIVVPAIGAPTCRGVAVRIVNLGPYERETDRHLERDMLIRVCADRAVRDGAVLCLRPVECPGHRGTCGAGKCDKVVRPACVGLSATAFAVASLQDDFAARALVVDPYDDAGNDIREGVPVASMGPGLTAEEAHDVAVWEGSEAV